MDCIVLSVVATGYKGADRQRSRGRAFVSWDNECIYLALQVTTRRCTVKNQEMGAAAPVFIIKLEVGAKRKSHLISMMERLTRVMALDPSLPRKGRD